MLIKPFIPSLLISSNWLKLKIEVFAKTKSPSIANPATKTGKETKQSNADVGTAPHTIVTCSLLHYHYLQPAIPSINLETVSAITHYKKNLHPLQLYFLKLS
jgi:hypothetical protein